MEFFVGQRVSYLHESGEGRVTAIIDKENLEVDFGDDFPMDVHIDEIIPSHDQQDRFFGKKGAVDTDDPKVARVLGTDLFNISLVVCPEGEDAYKFSLVNPESKGVIYTFYKKSKHKYIGIAHGRVQIGGIEALCVLKETELQSMRSLYFQMLFFKEGKGYPEVPLVRELPWSKDLLKKEAKLVRALDRKGWIFPIREEVKAPELNADSKDKTPKKKPLMVVDLHIEKLVSNPYSLDKTILMGMQLDHFEKTLSDALMQNVEKLIIIHGVGHGKLRIAIRNRLSQTNHVRSFGPADSHKYGDGATEVLFM